MLGITLVVVGIFIGLCCILETYLEKSNLKIKEEGTNKYIDECRGFKLKEIFYSNVAHLLAITEDNKMFFASGDEKVLLEYEDLLKIDLEYSIKTKHTQQVVSIIPTVNTSTQLLKVYLVIVTIHKTYRFYYEPQYKDVIERYKLVVEKYKEESKQK